jgi:hypothetical protein
MRLITLLSVLFAVLTGTANAALISRDFHNPGDGLLTLDASTNLLWLDLPVSQLFTSGGSHGSFDFVSGQLGPGGMFQGFRYGTPDEVNRLFADAGLPPIPPPGSGAPGDNPGTPASLARVLDFIALFGQTDCLPPCSGAAGSLGILGAPLANGNVLVAGPWHQGEDVSKVISSFIGEASTGGEGSFLVRPAPVPATFLLLVVGLVGLVATSRRAKCLSSAAEASD